MKKLICLLFLAGMSQVGQAQFKTIAEGPEFPEYREGYTKVLQLKNGNTIILHFSIKLGIDVQLYDPSHKRILNQTIQPSYGKLRGGDFDAIFESQGDVVVLLSERTERHPILRRLIFDGKAGKLKKEDVLVDLVKETKRGKRYSSGSSSDFGVVKDPYSDCYAVATEKNGEGGEVIHYGADHAIISRADLPIASSRKNFEFVYEDMVVKGNEGVYVLLTEKDADLTKSEAELHLAILKKGDKAYSFTPLSFSKNEDIEGAAMRYNPSTNELFMLQYLERKVKKEDKTFHTFFSTYNIATNATTKPRELSLRTAETKTKEAFGARGKYEGGFLPQNLYIQPDGSFVVVHEENDITTQGSRDQYVNTTFGNLAVIGYDKSGTETSCQVIPRKIFVGGMAFRPFYHKRRENTAEWMEMGNQYKFFSFVSGAAHNYIVVNDRNDNNQALKDKKVKLVGGIGDCYGYYYTLDGKEIFPKREFIFTSADAERFNNVGIFISSDNSAGSYATIRVSPRDQKKARVVWLTRE